MKDRLRVRLTTLKGLQQLTKIGLYNTTVTRIGSQELAVLKQLHNLNFGLNPLNDVDAQRLFLSCHSLAANLLVHSPLRE